MTDPMQPAIAASQITSDLQIVDVYLVMVRLEGKMDTAISAIRARTDDHAGSLRDHETRLRVIEGVPPINPDLEQRLRILERKPTVTPAALWAAVVTAAGLFFALTEFFGPLIGGAVAG